MITLKGPMNELDALPRQHAAAILSRAALDIETGGLNPAAFPTTPYEASIRERLIERLKSSFESTNDDNKTDLNEWILQRLDEATSELDPSQDEPAALERLILNAALPSDVYDVTFEQQAEAELFPMLPPNEREHVLEVIRSPGYEEDFGPSITPNAPSPVSLFGRWYDLGRPRDRFLLVVIGSRRENRRISVHHFWRIYPIDINICACKTLVDVIERFAEKYGADLEIAGWRGHFLRYMALPELSWKLNLPNQKGRRVMVFVVTRHPTPQTTEFAFAIGVDLNAYFSDVKNHAKFEFPSQP
jgi:hypothetical protein